jgi:hypothetical protein
MPSVIKVEPIGIAVPNENAVISAPAVIYTKPIPVTVTILSHGIGGFEFNSKN